MGSPRTKAALFLNPAAASGRARSGAATVMLARHFDLTVHTPPSAEAMESMAANEARQGCGLVIAGGGDGTVNIVVNAMAGTDAALGILPIGTANDFALQLGIPRNAEAAAERIIAGSRKRFDLVAVNGRRFCTVGGLGLVTECALSANRLRSAGHPLRPFARSIGPAIYPVVGATKIVWGEHSTWEMNLTRTGPDSEPAPGCAWVHGIFCANQGVFGGGLKLPVEARNDDGTIEICVVPATSRLRLLRTLFALRMAWPINRDVMRVHRVTQARIEFKHEVGFLGDGELLCAGRHFELEVLPGGLSAIC